MAPDESYGDGDHRAPEPDRGDTPTLPNPLTIIDRHVLWIGEDDEELITINRFDINADNADLAHRTCRCGDHINGFDEYVEHLKEKIAEASE